MSESIFFNGLCEKLSGLPEIEAIVLGGSRANGKDFDKKSDYDLYVYCSSIPNEDIRNSILSKYCKYLELGNTFWEFEDDCTLNDDIDIDIIYRNINDFEKTLKSVVFDHVAYNGYTTCMWHNLLNSRVIYESNHLYSNLQQKFNISYPYELKRNIIIKNLKLLNGFLPSYDKQINKAWSRKDLISINHRVSAFMESYFDIIFALNEMTHPGEKRMLEKAIEGKFLPENFEENIKILYQNLFVNAESTYITLKRIVIELKKILDEYSCN
ncbi:MAG: hypothetical protein ACI4V7_01725 [Succinivibrionaceae bacterium]